jgi:hypothetical protein
MTTITAAKGTRVTTTECVTPVTGVLAMLSRAAAGLACAALVASAASACKPVTPGASAAAPASRAAPASAAARASAKASSDPSCTQALEAASTYGPAAVRDAVEDKESLDKAEIDLIVLVLNEAANSAGNPAVKQSIISLVTAYLKLRDSLSGTIDSAIEKRIVGNTSNLKSKCGS